MPGQALQSQGQAARAGGRFRWIEMLCPIEKCIFLYIMNVEIVDAFLHEMEGWMSKNSHIIFLRDA
jgi:hypothetical protein